MKFAWHNTKTFEKADTILFGVPDETGSHASRKGASKGPARFRKVSNERAVVFRNKKKSLFQGETGELKKKIFDYGNVKKKNTTKFAEKVFKAGKMPVAIGGDHSITYEVLKAIPFKDKASVIYFDAHPDFICSDRFYYGSVVCDAMKLKNVNIKKSCEVGVRALEVEEIKNIEKHGIKVFTPVHLLEDGVKKIMTHIKKLIGKNKIYLSVDLDSVDPAFAPGVDTPIPGGLSSNELIYLCKEIAKLNLIGFDVMELSPPHDLNDMTSDLANKLVIEILSSKN